MKNLNIKYSSDSWRDTVEFVCDLLIFEDEGLILNVCVFVNSQCGEEKVVCSRLDMMEFLEAVYCGG